MDKRERYHWDVFGYLIVRNVLTGDMIEAANRAIDLHRDQVEWRPIQSAELPTMCGTAQARFEGMLTWAQPYCDPFRNMLAHPVVVDRLNVMCDPGFRLDHGPWVFVSEKGTEGLALHGSGEPHRPNVAYHHQNDKMYCGGVTVTWQLEATDGGDGGFICVPGSHKSKVAMPASVRTCEDDLGASAQPVMQAGDVLFFMDGAQTHGSQPWRGKNPRRSVLFKYAARSAARGGVASDVAPPQIYWGPQLIDGMTEVQRAVMHGPTSGSNVPSLGVNNDGDVYIEKD